MIAVSSHKCDICLSDMICSWYLVPGTWYLVPGTWYLVPGTWYLVPAPRGTGTDRYW